MFLTSIADRSRLCEGEAQLLVHLGGQEVFRLPWKLFQSISTKAHLAYAFGPTHKTLQVPVQFHPGAFKYIIAWFTKMLKSPGFFLMKSRNSIKEDVPLCRAARMLGLEEYTQHIFLHYWNMLNESLPSFEDLAKLENSAVMEDNLGLMGYDGYLLLRRACEHLACVILADGIKDFQQWTEFFTAHRKLGLQVCEETQRLHDERSKSKRDEAEVQQAVVVQTTAETANPKVKLEDVRSVTSLSPGNLREAQVVEPAPQTRQQQPPSQSNEAAQPPTTCSAEPHKTMDAHNGLQTAQPEMNFNLRLSQAPWVRQPTTSHAGAGMRPNAVPFKPSQTTYQQQRPVVQPIGSPPSKETVDAARQRTFNTCDHFGAANQGPWNRKATPQPSTPMKAPAVQAPNIPAIGIPDAHDKVSNKKPAKAAPVKKTIDTAGVDLVALAKKLFPTPKDPQEAMAWLPPLVAHLRQQNELDRMETYRASVDQNFEFSNSYWKVDWSHQVTAEEVQPVTMPTARASSPHQGPQNLAQNSMADSGPGSFGYRQNTGSGHLSWNENAGVIGGRRNADHAAGIIGHHRKNSSGDAGVIGDRRNNSSGNAGIIGHRRNTSPGDANADINGGVGVSRLGPDVGFF